MRLTSFGIVLVLLTSFMVGRASAQIPERALFQPGSYAHGMARTTAAAGGGYAIMQPMLVEVPAEAASGENAATDDDAPKTGWEEEFPAENADGEAGETVLTEVMVPVPVKITSVPHLAYHRCPVTHRIHVIPYEPGYAAVPEEFPTHQSKVNLLLSSLPCRTQDRPQVKYASYYDEDPVIIQDKPSRLQLILGYPNGAWTSPCENQWGHRMAQCPGVVPVPMGTYAEAGIKDQPYDNCPQQGPLGGVFRGPRPLDYGTMAPPVRRGFGLRGAPMVSAQDACPCEFYGPAAAPKPGPYPRQACPPQAAPCKENCGCSDCVAPKECVAKKNCACKSCVSKNACPSKKACGCKSCVKRVPTPPRKNYPLKKTGCSETDEAETAEPVAAETTPEVAKK